MIRRDFLKSAVALALGAYAPLCRATVVQVAPSGGDDTATINAAYASLRGDPNVYVGAVEVGGDYGVSAGINMTGQKKLLLISRSGARIRPLAHGMQTIVDMTGSRSEIDGAIQIGVQGSPYKPACGVMALQNPQLQANKLRLRGVDIEGSYDFASLYVAGVASSSMADTTVWNHSSHYAAVFSADNFVGFISPYHDTLQGVGPMSDWTMTACEFHGNVPIGEMSYCMMIRGASSLRFNGGNFSSSGAGGYVSLSADAAGNICHSLMFLGPTFYSENGNDPQYIFTASAPSGKTHHVHHRGLDAHYSAAFSSGPITFY